MMEEAIDNVVVSVSAIRNWETRAYIQRLKLSI